MNLNKLTNSQVESISTDILREWCLDVLLIHPPAHPNPKVKSPGISLFDADTGYSQQFVSISTGLINIASNLEKEGFRIKILNLAEIAYYLANNFKLQEWIEPLNVPIVGISLQWSVHSWGSIEIVKLINKLHPKTLIYYGGLTASLFYRDILEFPSIRVDGVMVGEADISFVDVVKSVLHEKDIDNIPGLYKKDKKGYINDTLKPIPPDLLNLDFSRYDLIYPNIFYSERGNVTILRGCKYDCSYCGAGKKAYQKCMQHRGERFLSPKELIRQLKLLEKIGKTRLYLYGDFRIFGEKYRQEFLDYAKNADIKCRVVVEFFTPGNEKYIDFLQSAFPKLEATLSPESGNEKIREKVYKRYSNKELIRHCEIVSERQIPQSTYFMMCLPMQGPAEVQSDFSIMEQLLDIYLKNNRYNDLNHDIIPYTLLQYPDPGSVIFQQPEKFGYTLLIKSFNDLVQSLKSQTWQDIIGYKTSWFPDRKIIVETFVSVCRKRALLYYERGIINENEYKLHIHNIEKDISNLKVINANLRTSW